MRFIALPAVALVVALIRSVEAQPFRGNQNGRLPYNNDYTKGPRWVANGDEPLRGGNTNKIGNSQRNGNGMAVSSEFESQASASKTENRSWNIKSRRRRAFYSIVVDGDNGLPPSSVDQAENSNESTDDLDNDEDLDRASYSIVVDGDTGIPPSVDQAENSIENGLDDLGQDEELQEEMDETAETLLEELNLLLEEEQEDQKELEDEIFGDGD